jgi:carotenoid cleavage dioxygenase-like enzyme
VSDPGREGAGVLLCKRFDARREQDAYLFFDADAVGAGPVAELPLEGATPPCFHGSYYPAPA